MSDPWFEGLCPPADARLHAAALRLARAVDAIEAHEDDIPRPLPTEDESCAAWSSRHASLSRELYAALAAFRALDVTP